MLWEDVACRAGEEMEMRSWIKLQFILRQFPHTVHNFTYTALAEDSSLEGGSKMKGVIINGWMILVCRVDLVIKLSPPCLGPRQVIVLSKTRPNLQTDHESSMVSE